MVLLAAFLVLTEQAPHGKRIQLKNTLKSLKEKYFLVEKQSATIQFPMPRSKRNAISSEPTPSKYCPWRWVRDTRSPQIRFNQLRAECVGTRCRTSCKTVYYTIKVLVKKGRHPRTNMDRWTLKSKRIVVAYFYSKM